MDHHRLFIVLICCSSLACPSQARPTNSPPGSSQVVTELLTTLFRQTIYHRIENLLLDPGRKSSEKQQLIESAVDNYHRQKMVLPVSDKQGTDEQAQEITTDLTNLTGEENFIRLPDKSRLK